MNTTVADRGPARTTTDTWNPLDDPATRHLARACLRKGQPLVEVAQVLGMCADELADLLRG